MYCRVGLVGVILRPFLAGGEGIFWTGNESDQWIQLGVNIAGLLVITAWAGGHCLLIFGGLKYFNLLRIDNETELVGCDITKHGESAYPVEAWNEIQYDTRSSKQTQLPITIRQNEPSGIESCEHSSGAQNRHFKSGVDNKAMENNE